MVLKLLKCKHCGNIVELIEDRGVPILCCGEKMELLEAGAVDAAQEKHVPVVKRDGNKVHVVVGSVIHPMSEEHHIAFIILATDKCMYRYHLPHDGKPEAVFHLASKDERPLAVFEYCNLHGLWQASCDGID